MSKDTWPLLPLKELSSRIGDGIHGTPEYVELSEYPFINGNNLKNGSIVVTNETKMVSKEEYNKYLIEFDQNTLFMSINGTLGSLAKYKDETITLGKSAAYIKCNEIDVNFLYYYLQLQEVQKHMWNTATGSTIKNLSLESIRNLRIPKPHEHEQKVIAAVLSALDAKIELNNRINTELEAMAKTLYDYWFVQFDFPGENGQPYKSSDGKMVYNEILKREIPEGWQVKALADHLDCNTKTLGKKHSLSEIKYLNTANLTKNVIDSIQQLNVGQDKIPSRANMLVSKNDILYSTVRPNQYHHGLINNPVITWLRLRDLLFFLIGLILHTTQSFIYI